MSWSSWFSRRPLLQKEIEEIRPEEDSCTGVPRPSPPLAIMPHAPVAPEDATPTAAAASHVSPTAAAKQALQGLDSSDTGAATVDATGSIHAGGATTDTMGAGPDCFELEEGALCVADEPCAEIVEEALAVAHTVFSETCGAAAVSTNSEVTEDLSCTSGARAGPGDERPASQSDMQVNTAELPQVQDETCCDALVPSSTAGDHQQYSCILDLGALRAQRLDSDTGMMHQALGPDVPSLHQLLACTEPHEILGVPRDANKETLKKAYRNRARCFHPDKHRGIDQDVDRAFTQAFMLITRAYMRLLGGDAHQHRLHILNKVDLRRDRPAEGWASQQKYDEKRRERLTRAERALMDARKEVSLAQQACVQTGEQTTPKESRAQQRRLARAKLALSKAEATVEAETELYRIQQEKDREKIMQRLQKEERTKDAKARNSAQKPPARKRQRDVHKTQENPADIIAEAARLEAQAEEMRKQAANLRAQAQQGAPCVRQQHGESPDDLQSVRPTKRRLVIQGCSSGTSQ